MRCKEAPYKSGDFGNNMKKGNNMHRYPAKNHEGCARTCMIYTYVLKHIAWAAKRARQQFQDIQRVDTLLGVTLVRSGHDPVYRKKSLEHACGNFEILLTFIMTTSQGLDSSIIRRP